jgi:colanic acid/amylovoran biosynthesis protein
MNILISNVYSWKNKGDAAIILSMIDHIKSEFPNAKISISSIDHNDIGKYNEDSFNLNFLTIAKKPYLKAEYSFFSRLKYILSCNILRFKLNIFGFFAKKNLYLYSIFPTNLKRKIQSYQSCDLIIAAGGGYFISKSQKNKLERYLNHDEQVLFAYDFYLATFFKKPYILYNQSIGPFFSNQDELNLLPFFKKSEAIICREQLTYDRMQKLGLNNLILSEDAAFNLKSTQNNILEKYTKITDEISIGFTVRQCLPEVFQTIYEHEITLFIQEILQLDKASKVYFMPQVTYEDGGDNDLHVARRIREAVDKHLRNRVIIIDEDVHPSNLKYMIGRMNYFFGTRMHSCIFSLASNVKTIALSYEPKTDGIMKSLKMDDYFINVKDLTEKKLLNLYHKIMDDTTYYERLKKEVERVQKESLVDLRKILRRQI